MLYKRWTATFQYHSTLLAGHAGTEWQHNVFQLADIPQTVNLTGCVRYLHLFVFESLAATVHVLMDLVISFSLPNLSNYLTIAEGAAGLSVLDTH